jgi:hypothetical protein
MTHSRVFFGLLVAVWVGSTADAQTTRSGRTRIRDLPFFTAPLPTYPSGYALGGVNNRANPETSISYPGYGLGSSSGGPGYQYRGYHSYSPSYGYGQSGFGFGWFGPGPVLQGAYGPPTGVWGFGGGIGYGPYFRR